LDKVCIQNFMYEMELKPGSQRNMLAMTGVITSTTAKNSLITVLQDMEYVSNAQSTPSTRLYFYKVEHGSPKYT
jgi:hypothetical protein